MKKCRSYAIVGLLVLAVSVGSMLIGCGYPEDETSTQPQHSIVTNLPTPPPKTGHPDLDTALSELIEAKKQGNEEAFARERGLELVDGGVGVLIRAEPGQKDAAMLVVRRFGTIYDVYPGDSRLITAVVPIDSLISLVDDDNIQSIRVAEKALSGD